MTYEEKKKLIEAAKVLQEYCDSIECKDCPFWSSSCKIGCEITGKFPTCWKIPTITRWTPEDVALAKALKLAGIERIYRVSYGEINLFRVSYAGELLNSNMFLGLGCEEGIDLDTIIKEAEG